MYYAYGPSILTAIFWSLNIWNDETVINVQDGLHFVHPVIVTGGLKLKE